MNILDLNNFINKRISAPGNKLYAKTDSPNNLMILISNIDNLTRSNFVNVTQDFMTDTLIFEIVGMEELLKDNTFYICIDSDSIYLTFQDEVISRIAQDLYESFNDIYIKLLNNLNIWFEEFKKKYLKLMNSKACMSDIIELAKMKKYSFNSATLYYEKENIRLKIGIDNIIMRIKGNDSFFEYGIDYLDRNCGDVFSKIEDYILFYKCLPERMK